MGGSGCIFNFHFNQAIVSVSFAISKVCILLGNKMCRIEKICLTNIITHIYQIILILYFFPEKYYKMIIKAVRKHAIKMTGKKVYVLIMKKFKGNF